MVKNCQELASHKVGEQNIYDKNSQQEEYENFNRSHELTTYLCDSHFNFIMDRDTQYFQTDDRFPKKLEV